jgi:plasmid stabilization system protein ParE
LIDIDEIAIYVGQESAAAAHRIVDEIYSAVQSLVPFPHRGHSRPDLTSRPVRFMRVRDYLIAYAPDAKPLWVVAVIHGHRSPRVMAAILRGREG